MGHRKRRDVLVKRKIFFLTGIQGPDLSDSSTIIIIIIIINTFCLLRLTGG